MEWLGAMINEVGAIGVEDITPAVDAKVLHQHMHRLQVQAMPWQCARCAH